MRRTWTVVGLLTGSVLLATRPSAAQLIPPPVVNPATYQSRSGEYILEVDPSQMYGEGAANYRLTHQGKELWSGERPFTLLGAGVGDDGVVAGYAYSGGLQGFAKDDKLHLLILGPAGAVRLDDATPRQESRLLHGGPQPTVDGIVLDPDNDRVVFRVSNDADPEIWKPYQLSTGKPSPPFEPHSLMATGGLNLSVVDAQPVCGTPLTLIHWSRVNWAKEEHGTRFTLVDRSGKPVWMLELPNDYRAPSGDRKAQERMWQLASSSAILDVSRPKIFEIRVVETAARVLHRVEQDRKRRWKVEETARLPLTDVARATPSDTVDAGPERPLRYLGAIQLGGGPDNRTGAIRNVHQFDFDAQGRFGFVRDDGQCDLTLVIGSEKESSRETRLGRLDQQYCGWPLVAWTGGKTWLVTVQFAKAKNGSVGWWVDGESGTARPFSLPDGTSVRAVAGRPTGGVVLLGEQETLRAWGSESRTVLLWINAQGLVDRAFSEAANNSDSELLSPDDVAVTTAGEVMVIDVIRHKVVVFDLMGSLRRTIDLEKAWGREPSYPSGIAPDIEGGFIVEDFQGEVPFVRMHGDGTVLSELQPGYDDGRPTGRLFRVQASPDGALWGSDGEALLRLSEDGIVEGAAGGPATMDVLGEVAALTLDVSDNIYAADRRTGAVHVFSREGELDHVCRPDPGDVTDALDSPSLTITDDGRVFLRAGDWPMDEGKFLEFSSKGERSATHSWADESRLWNSATGGFWATRGNDLVVVGEDGQIIQTVARRADRRWLEWVSGAVVAPDGSIAVAAGSSNLRAESKEPTLNLYSSDGSPIEMIRLTGEDSGRHFAYDGRTLAAWQSGEVRMWNLSGQPTGRFKPRPGGKEANDWPLFITAHGQELWMFEAATKTMHRFEMP